MQTSAGTSTESTLFGLTRPNWNDTFMILQDGEEGDDESSEEETSSEEAGEEEEADDRPEDDRMEADRASAAGARVAAPALFASKHGVAGSGMTESVNRSVTDMTGSAVVGSEMTESADPACVTTASSEERDTSDSREVTPSKSESGVSSSESGNASVVSHNAATAGEDGDQLNNSSQTQKKNKSSASSAASKRIVAEHKKVVKSASSRLADYIKSPLPPAKPKKEKNIEHVTKKSNASNTKANKAVGKNQGHSNVVDQSKGDTGEEKRERKPKPVKEETPKVKRIAPKSKWGNIMSRIEANKDTVKVKPKTEIKSSLAVYLCSPTTPNNNPTHTNEKEQETNKQKEEPAPKPKPKPKLVKHPKPDFSNIKSKLNIALPPRQPKPRERSTSPSHGNPREGENPGKPKDPGSTAGLAKKPAGNCSSVSQGSCTDLSVFDSVDGSSAAGQSPMEKMRE